MNTYGFHTIHGRAPTLATGLKAARPDLMVWVITGDGDALSIGGNHLMHSMRRNVDIKIILFNNRIYGLTKGQSRRRPSSARRPSPRRRARSTSRSCRCRSRSPPRRPSSRARSTPTPSTSRTTLERAGCHHGTAFVEVYQNCNIFNDGAFESFTDREVREDRMLVLEHGKPMIFGKDRDKGIRLNGLHPEVVAAGRDGITEDDLLVHDEKAEDPYLAFMLSRMFWPDFPVPSACCAASSGRRTTS